MKIKFTGCVFIVIKASEVVQTTLKLILKGQC
jgi:hypothetical protein